MASSRMDEIQNLVKSHIPTQSGSSSESKIENDSATHISLPSIHPGKVVNSGFPAVAGELDDDREELLFSANFALKASYRACSKSFWKKMECYFTSVTPQDESYLKHQLDFADALSGTFYQIPGDENDDSLQQLPIYSGGRQRSPADQEFRGTKKTPVEAPSIHQRLISAFIEDDESREMNLHGEGRNDFLCASDDSHSAAENRDKMAFKNINCEAKGRHKDQEVHPQLRKQGVVDRISENDRGSVDDKLRVELHRLDLCPEMHSINKDIFELEGLLVQQALKKLKYIRKFYDSVQQGKHAEKRKLEQAAMSKLIEMAYKKQRVSRLRASSKTVLRRVSKPFALPFAERTLAKCREFEDTGRSCFREGALQNIVFSTPKSNSFPNPVGKHTSRSSNSVQPIPKPKPEVKASNLLLSGSEPGSRNMEATHAASDSPHIQDQDWQGLDIPMDDLTDVDFLSWF